MLAGVVGGARILAAELGLGMKVWTFTRSRILYLYRLRWAIDRAL